MSIHTTQLFWTPWIYHLKASLVISSCHLGPGPGETLFPRQNTTWVETMMFGGICDTRSSPRARHSGHELSNTCIEVYGQTSSVEHGACTESSLGVLIARMNYSSCLGVVFWTLWCAGSVLIKQWKVTSGLAVDRKYGEVLQLRTGSASIYRSCN